MALPLRLLLRVIIEPSGSLRRCEHTYSFLAATLLRAAIVMSYNTSLNANRNAAVRTLWVTFGPIPSAKDDQQRHPPFLP